MAWQRATSSVGLLATQRLQQRVEVSDVLAETNKPHDSAC